MVPSSVPFRTTWSAERTAASGGVRAARAQASLVAG